LLRYDRPVPVRPISARIEPTFHAFREKARALLTAEVAPEAVVWSEEKQPAPSAARYQQSSNHQSSNHQSSNPQIQLRVSRHFVALAELAACHRATDRWPLLYRILWRLGHENTRLLNDATDADVSKLVKMAEDVRQDIDQMKRSVRFRAIGEQHQEYFIGWHRAEHRIGPLVAPFFAERYPNIRWTLFTPQRTIHWDGRALSFGDGVAAHELPAPDSDAGADKLWRTYRLRAWKTEGSTPSAR
jgi:DNA polymerase